MPDVSPTPTPVQVQIAPKGWYEALVDMLLKQGATAVVLAIAVYFLWGQIQKLTDTHAGVVVKMETEHTTQLENQGELYKAEMKERLEQTERLLTRKIDKVDQTTVRNTLHLDEVKQKADVAAKTAEALDKKVTQLMPP